MANAYATIASGGWRNKPIVIKKVVFPDHKSENLGKPRRTRAFSDGVTAEATKILQANVTGGTGVKAQIGCPAAGKTGTTDSFNDAWFVGYTPRLATAVWVGYPNAQVEMRNVHGISVAGGTFPAMIWHDYMQVAKGNDCQDFAAPKTPFVSTAFFGKYESIAPVVSADADAKKSKDAESTGGAGAPKDKGNGYNPKLYESPPQAAPGTGAPSAPGR
jgi:penicillin-binding protein 1A